MLGSELLTLLLGHGEVLGVGLVRYKAQDYLRTRMLLDLLQPVFNVLKRAPVCYIVA